MHRLVFAALLALFLIPAGQAMAQTPAAAPVATSQEAQADSQDTAIPAQTDTTPTDTTPTDTDTTPQENTDDPDEEEFGEDVEDQETTPEPAPEPAQEAAPPPAPAPAPELPRTGSDPAILIAALSLFLLGMALRRVTRPA